MLIVLSRLDGLLQKVVDSAAFVLMRRLGWTKAYLRFCLTAVALAGMGGTIVIGVKVHGWGGSAFFMTLCLAIWMAFTHYGYISDTRAESRNSILYPGDVRRLPMLSISKCMWFLFLALDVFIAVTGPSPDGKIVGGMFTFKCFCNIVWDVALILENYLVKTPRVPPALEENKTVLVPAHATSRS